MSIVTKYARTCSSEQFPRMSDSRASVFLRFFRRLPSIASLRSRTVRSEKYCRAQSRMPFLHPTISFFIFCFDTENGYPIRIGVFGFRFILLRLDDDRKEEQPTIRVAAGQESRWTRPFFVLQCNRLEQYFSYPVNRSSSRA